MLWSIDSEHDRRIAADLCPRGVAREALAGVRWGYIPGYDLVWTEGRAGQPLGMEGLCPPAALGDVHEAVRQALRGLGFHWIRSEGVARLDPTVTIRFAERGQGLAALQGMAALDVPRRKPDVIGRPPETVYLLSHSGTKLERIYDKGRESATAPVGTLIRWEAQVRFKSDGRRDISEWDRDSVKGVFNRRFAAMSAAAEGITVATMVEVNRTLARMVEDGRLSARQAELLMGHIAAEGVGLRRPKRTRMRRRAELRRLGLALALDGFSPDDDVQVDLGAVMAEALTTDRWDG